MLSPVFRASGALLLLGAACAAAIVPEPAVANVTDKLEALVRDMVENQQGAPKPKATSEDMVIVDEGERRRRLGPCDCNTYRNGATPGSGVCSKKEGGLKVCYPVPHSGYCSDHSATLCSAASLAFPSPVPLLDAEDAEAADDTLFLNLNLQIYAAQTANLPSPSAFAAAVAEMIQMDPKDVSVLTTWGAPSAVRSVQAVAQAGDGASLVPSAMLHATIATRSAQRAEQLQALVSGQAALPPINGKVYKLLNVQAHELSSNAAACRTTHHKADSASLLSQLAALKQEEVELMRQAVAHAATQQGVDTALLNQMAIRLGLGGQ